MVYLLWLMFIQSITKYKSVNEQEWNYNVLNAHDMFKYIAVCEPQVSQDIASHLIMKWTLV